MDGTAVDGFECQAVPKIFFANACRELRGDFLMDPLKERDFNTDPRPAIARSIRGWNGKPVGSRPVLDVADRSLTGTVFFQDLGKPGPEDRDVAVAALALRRVDRREEGTGKNIIEQYSISAERRPHQGGATGSDCRLKTALGASKDVKRKVGEVGLFGHTFKPYPNRLSV